MPVVAKTTEPWMSACCYHAVDHCTKTLAVQWQDADHVSKGPFTKAFLTYYKGPLFMVTSAFLQCF